MNGKILGSRYEIIEMIDSGGMAYVYKAMCKKTKKIVAVKVLKEKFTNSAEYVKRFKKEAEAVFSLEHINIVRVTDVGYDEGVYYMVMEYIEGKSLKALIKEKSIIEEKQAIEYAIKICSALASAHQNGIIHRDIKPQNILIDKNGEVKVTDFGIAKSVSSKEETEDKVMGSVYYISPEQAKGEKIDVRTDIYSLGILLYEMNTGVLPFTGEKTISVALKHLNERIVPPSVNNPELSESVNNIILKATNKNKKDRYRSMKELKDDLVRALVDKSGSFVEVLPEHTLLKKTINLKKHRFWKAGILFVLILAAAAIVFFGSEALQSDKQRKLLIPDAIGLKVSSAVEMFERIGLETQIIYEPSETIKEGIIIAQAPQEGAEAVLEDAVSLTASSGPADLIMPEVFGLRLEEAEKIIEDLGLVIEDIVYESREDMPEGNVVSQIPEAGSVIVEDDLVNLVVCGDVMKNDAAVPQVTNMPLDQAVCLLYEAGFTNCFVYQDKSELEPDLEPGIVFAQGPEQGIQTPLTSDIDLWISEYDIKPYTGNFKAQIEIPEKDSKVKIVLEEMMGGNIVNFVIQEKPEEAGLLLLDMKIDFHSDGTKVIKIYINNEELYTDEVNFAEWTDTITG